MINKKNAEFRAMLTEATNASFDCGEYEFYAGEKVEENYADLEDKSTAKRAKVIETYSELERENAKLRELGNALRDALAFECHKMGDFPREIDAWDALVSALPNAQAQR
jgi:hypothetical protein